MFHPLVSVIIPTYNRLDFLLEAIESVQSQDYDHLELIVVDDGSTDGTKDKLKDMEITYIFIEHSGRPGYVRNMGVKQSRGEYIAFLDSDDLWERGKIKRQIDYFAKHPQIHLCHTREVWLRGSKIISQSKQKHKRSGYIFSDALKKCIIGPSSVIMERRVFNKLGMFHPDIEIAEDYELWLRYCSRYPVGYIDEPLTVKRGGHSDQLSWKYQQIEIFRIKALIHFIKNEIIPYENLILAKKELVRKCKIYASGCLKRKKIKDAEHYLKLVRIYSR
jgi:glycosyltransferase involved in cell wall biosynthesis